jgi:hypothetical protein
LFFLLETRAAIPVMTRAPRKTRVVISRSSGDACKKLNPGIWFSPFLLAEFFDDRLSNPQLIQKAVEGLKTLSDSDVLLILNYINRLQQR